MGATDDVDFLLSAMRELRVKDEKLERMRERRLLRSADVRFASRSITCESLSAVSESSGGAIAIESNNWTNADVEVVIVQTAKWRVTS